MNIIEIFPKTYVIEFQISDNPNEVTEKLNPYLSSVGKNNPLQLSSYRYSTGKKGPLLGLYEIKELHHQLFDHLKTKKTVYMFI